jgi:hypothetical protein
VFHGCAKGSLEIGATVVIYLKFVVVFCIFPCVFLNTINFLRMKFVRHVQVDRKCKLVPLEEAKMQALAFFWEYLCMYAHADNIYIMDYPLRAIQWNPTQPLRLRAPNGSYSYISRSALQHVSTNDSICSQSFRLRRRDRAGFRLQLSRDVRDCVRHLVNDMYKSVSWLRHRMHSLDRRKIARSPAYVYLEPFELQMTPLRDRGSALVCHCINNFTVYLSRKVPEDDEGDERF